MGAEPAVNAVFFNKIQAIEDPDERAAFVAEQRAEYEADVDLVHLAAELVVDAVVAARGPARRARRAASRSPRTRVRDDFDRRHGVPPV